jgi:hypothetical protein
MRSALGELGVPQASMAGYFAHPPRIFLGGYPFGYGTGWDHFHQPNTLLLLNMISQGDPQFHLGIPIEKRTNGEVQHQIDVSCTN